MIQRKIASVALSVGAASAFLSWMALSPTNSTRAFDWLESPAIFAFLPGMLLGFAVSGNIHTASTWVVALGNFVFYVALVYLVSAKWKKRKTRRVGRTEGEL